MNVRIPLPLLLLCACTFTPLHAQQAAPTLNADTSVEPRRGWSALRVAKWSTATAAAGTTLYGFLNNQRADAEYARLEQVCVDQPIRCETRLPNGAYADAELEAQYQDARAIDRRARTALVAGQIGVAASVVLFILDLRNSDPPANIPYEPRTFDVMPARDGGVSLRLNLQLPARH
ncbi:MAG: hypothetical protein ACREK1_12795 [Longimicrobiales bacterium]